MNAVCPACPIRNAVCRWLAQRTGWENLLRWAAPPPGRKAGWSRVWPCAIGFTFFIQAATGFFVWMHYSPSVQNAWESVYYLQNHVIGGWLLRAMHHHAGQVLLVVVGLYLLQTIATAAYRAPRELVFWVILLMVAVTLGAMLTGDLLRWDQNGYSATQVRVGFLNLLPLVGDDLFKLVVGGPGPGFGQLTLTRFVALHIACFGGGFLVLIVLHLCLARRADAMEAGSTGSPSTPNATAAGAATCPGAPWTDQAWRNAIACAVVLAVVLLLSLRPVAGRFGLELGSPADQAGSYPAARPEWAFLGLYEFAHLFSTYVSGQWGIVPIFIIPGLTATVFLLMPWIGRGRGGHVFNVAFTSVLLTALVVLSLVSVAKDRADAKFLAAVDAEHQRAERTAELIAGYGGAPATGALSLLAADPKTRGPALCEQLCASCHVYRAPDAPPLGPDEPSAPDLFGLADRKWLADFLDPKQIASPRFYGNTRFAAGMMVRYVEGRFVKFKAEDRQAIVAALSAEAGLPLQMEADRKDAELLRRGRELIAKDDACTRCHEYRGQGREGVGPVLTGYGSRAWLVGVIADPTHPAFYGPRNDRMPSYATSPDDASKNLLPPRQIGLLADWIRADWYRPGAGRFRLDEPKPTSSAIVADWSARRPKAPEPETGPYAAARTLWRQEHCALCHAATGAPGGDLPAIDASAPDLGGFATRAWIAGLLDPKQVQTEKYFGASALRAGDMVGFVKDNLADLDDDEKNQIETIVIALSAEAALPSQKDLDAADAERIKQGPELFGQWGCLDCHKFHGEGTASGPDLTGYGSREWLTAIISDPQSKRFYGTRNDGMPSYHAHPDKPQRNLLTREQIDRIVSFLRAEP